MKTRLTLDMEQTLYAYLREQDFLTVEEVTIPHKNGIVDTLALQPGDTPVEDEWRCYELKVTKADFHSSAQLSFIGNYNYFVLPLDLFEKVKDEIPAAIGVMLYQPFDLSKNDQIHDPAVPGFLTVVKKPKFKKIEVDVDQLKEHFLYSLMREVDKAKRNKRGLDTFSDKKLFKELKKRSTGYEIYEPEINYYDRFIEETQNDAVEALQEEIDALNAELVTLKAKYRELKHS